MSDALSDIRKADRNRKIYSQVEYEDAIRDAHNDEREAIIELLEKSKDLILSISSKYSNDQSMMELGKIRAETYDGIIESLRSRGGFR